MKPPFQDPRFDLGAIREQLRPARGQRYWRSLDHVAGSGEFERFSHQEFPDHASEWLKQFDRRHFLKLMGASLALAGLTACTKQPVERIVPYVRQSEQIVPGKPLYYATAMTMGGYAVGLLAESHEGHPTKIEGNREHPISLGASNVFHQASLLDLYDPERSQAVLNGGQISSWEAFLSALHDALEMQAARNGAGVRILTETVTSPTLHAQLQAVLNKFPEARWHQFEPVNRDNVHDGARLAFGEVVAVQYRFDRARVVLSLDSDFMFSHPAGLRYTRDFMDGRRMGEGRTTMNRLYVVESTPTVTGSNADHRLALRPGEIETFARAMARQLGAMAVSGDHSLPPPLARWIPAIVADLQQNPGAGLVIAGESQPPIIHALAHAMNHRLGNVGQTLQYSASAEAQPMNQLNSLRALAEDLQSGKVDVLMMLGGNPAYTAPADLNFAQLLGNARLRIHLSPDVNETSVLCQWHVPQNHYLESWSDARAYDGTISLIQPLILPLYAGRSAHEVIEALVQQPVRSDYEIVRESGSLNIPGRTSRKAGARRCMMA
jgi:MoCo/4Fe-4S cofactor protein with predicted Tat translocation signal